MNQYRMVCSSIWRSGLVAVGLAMGLRLPAITQLPPPRPTGVYHQPGYAFSRFIGRVERYLLNPQGFVSGLLLRNGIQVFLPPTLANSIVTIVQPGDRVTVYGVPGMRNNFGLVARVLFNSAALIQRWSRQITGTVLAFRDITKRQRLESAG